MINFFVNFWDVDFPKSMILQNKVLSKILKSQWKTLANKRFATSPVGFGPPGE